MLKLEDNKRFSKEFVLFAWLLMAFQAGYVNVGGFYTSGNFVSHVTGTSSNIGMGLARLDISFILTFLTVLISFIVGAVFAGNFIGRYESEGKEPRYVLVTSVKCLFFFIILFLSELDSQNSLHLTQHTINTLIIFLLSFCCGAQNSTCSLSTNGFLKPTHMTGLSTDIGLNLAMYSPFRKITDPAEKKEFKKNNLRIGILFSFIFGGLIASMIFQDNGHYGFLFPFLSAFTFLIIGMLYQKENILANNYMLRTAKISLYTIFFATIFVGINGFN